MELVRLRIPYGFIRDRVRLSWRELRFGFENELAHPGVAVELALDRLEEIEEPPPALLELAGLSRDAPMARLVEQLAEGDAPAPENDVRDKWLYLVLAWIYEHRDMYADPLELVEAVYADFGYPEQIANLVRYMPMSDPDLGSREANERRMLEWWKQYLDGALESLGIRRSTAL